MSTIHSHDSDANAGAFEMIENLGRLKGQTCTFAAGEKIQGEGEANPYLHLILEGEVELLKSGQNNEQTRVDTFGQGDLLGLTSFWTGQESYLESRALVPVTCLRLGNEDVEQLAHQAPEIRETLLRLFISNLSNRYRRMVRLNLQVTELGETLRQERADLEKALEELRNTRDQLVLSEKLATLGQLMAGIAHEINNPCAALISSVENVTGSLADLLNMLDGGAEQSALLQSGLASQFVDTDMRRKRTDALSRDYPDLKRGLVRRIAALDTVAFEALELSEDLANDPAAVERRLACIELGADLRSIGLSSSRIGNLVKSLKSYARDGQGQWERLDLRDGIQDTLTVLNNKLRHYRLHVDLAPVPMVMGLGGDLNQVWTNLLINACQATEVGGDIWVATEVVDGSVVVTIADNGKGIDPSKLQKVFEANYTTKTGSSGFGLGLGLSISRDVIHKHKGTIIASNRPEGGACFTVTLGSA